MMYQAIETSYEETRVADATNQNVHDPIRCTIPRTVYFYYTDLV